MRKDVGMQNAKDEISEYLGQLEQRESEIEQLKQRETEALEMYDNA